MEEITKHINDTNASYRHVGAGDAKNTDLFLDNEHFDLFRDCGDQVTVRFDKTNLTQAILFIASILPRKFDQSANHYVVNYSNDFVFDQLAILDSLFKENGVSVNTITQVWNARKDVLKKNGEIDNRFYFNNLLKDVEFKNHNGDVQTTKFTIRNYLAGGFSELNIKKAADGIFDIKINNITESYNDGKEDKLEDIAISQLKWDDECSRQQIFYGAPGTGKSYTINELTENENVIRTTFHPDTDYSTFVGAYKPTMGLQPICDEIGQTVKIGSTVLYKEQITYEFVPQAFLQAYIAAWRKYAGAGENEPKKQFLVIEEINRGNCAQIFGDLFQLLDRNESGFSEYPIKADADMQKQLKKELYGLSVVNANKINALYNNRNVVSEVFNGDILLLPDNLYIWATMNTSDQSLFPIDSAFKRRWDWKYIPISNANKGWTIKVNGNKYDWWNFLEKINTQIGSTTNSEDKKLGYFFCKAANNEISAETFVGKVIFYLWNDVFKDYDFDSNIFKDDNGETMTFDKFYTAESKDVKVKEDKVEAFLEKLGVDATGQQGDDENNNVPNNISIRVNGKEIKYINAVPYTAVEEYVKMHPEMSAQQVIDVWEPFKKCSMRSWVVCNKEEHDSMEPKYANYSYEIKCSDGNSIWVNKDGWMHYPENQKLRDTINEFMSAVNNSNLGITITEIPA